MGREGGACRVRCGWEAHPSSDDDKKTAVGLSSRGSWGEDLNLSSAVL